MTSVDKRISNRMWMDISNVLYVTTIINVNTTIFYEIQIFLTNPYEIQIFLTNPLNNNIEPQISEFLDILEYNTIKE